MFKLIDIPDGFEEDFDALLNPSAIKTHEAARIGSKLIMRMDLDTKYGIFRDLCIRNKKPTDLSKALIEQYNLKSKAEESLIAALRRISFKATVLVPKYGAAKKSGKDKEESQYETYDILFGPNTSLDKHLRDADCAPKEYDCIQKMAGVASLLEKQFKAAYAYPARKNLPFFEVSKVNMLAQTYMNALGQLHKMQIDVGIVEKRPERMDVNLSQAGAFQTYVGELSQEHKQTMVNFAESFCKFVKEKGESSEQKD